MKLAWIIFGTLLTMGLILVGVTWTTEAPNGHGAVHPQFSLAMWQGGSSGERLGHLRWAGLAFGTLQMVFGTSCFLLCLRRSATARNWFIFAGLVNVGLFASVVIADAFFDAATPAPIVFGFPLPTALMVYGIWAGPILFVLFFVTQYDRWILTPKDLEQFQKRIEQIRQHESDR